MRENFETLLKEAASLRGKSVEKEKPIVEVLYFRLGQEYYGIELKEAKEIVAKAPVYPVPGTEEHILGVINLRGEIIPLIDLKFRLNLGKSNLEKPFQIIVIGIFEEPLAMLVDVVEDIVEVSEILSSEESVLKGKTQIGGKIVGLLDLKKIFYPED